MKYIINFRTGATHWAKEVDIPSMASLIGAGAVMSVIDIDAKKALISNDVEGKRNIGWATIPEYASFDPAQLSILEESKEKVDNNLGESN